MSEDIPTINFPKVFDWYFTPINYKVETIEEFRNQLHAEFNVWYTYRQMGIKSNRKYKVRFFRRKFGLEYGE